MGGGETAAGELGRHGRSNLAVEREVERKDSVWDGGLLIVSSDYGGKGRLGGGATVMLTVLVTVSLATTSGSQRWSGELVL